MPDRKLLPNQLFGSDPMCCGILRVRCQQLDVYPVRSELLHESHESNRLRSVSQRYVARTVCGSDNLRHLCAGRLLSDALAVFRLDEFMFFRARGRWVYLSWDLFRLLQRWRIVHLLRHRSMCTRPILPREHAHQDLSGWHVQPVVQPIVRSSLSCLSDGLLLSGQCDVRCVPGDRMSGRFISTARQSDLGVGVPVVSGWLLLSDQLLGADGLSGGLLLAVRQRDHGGNV